MARRLSGREFQRALDDEVARLEAMLVAEELRP